MIQFQETPRQVAGQKHEQTLFHRNLSGYRWGLKTATAVDCHLKVKDIECDVILSKNYCITVSIQKISLRI